MDLPLPAGKAPAGGAEGLQAPLRALEASYGPPFAPFPPSPPYGPYPPPPAYGYPPWWAYAPFPPGPPGPPRTAKPIVAGVVWCLLLLRHLGFLLILGILMIESGGRPFPPGAFISPITEPLTLMLIVLVGVAATVVVMVCDLLRSHYAVGTWAGAVAFGASLTPGVLLGFGVVGTVLGAIAFALHYASRLEFARPTSLDPYGQPTGS